MAILKDNAYGKSAVRLTKVRRLPGGRHELAELSVDVQLRGAFEASYLEGDNASVIATDTMKNTVYATAARHSFDDIETFATLLANHFVDRNPHVTSARVDIQQDLWARLRSAGGGEHPHAFASAGNEKRTCRVVRTRDATTIAAGLTDLFVLKTTDSAFAGFPRDEYTTLPETADRIFATSVSAEWDYDAAPADDYNARHAAVRAAMVDTFAHHKSLAVQQTQFAMGEAALAACDAVIEVRLEMPNRHRIPFNLAPLGLENRSEIFVTTSEPYGHIFATVRRG